MQGFLPDFDWCNWFKNIINRPKTYRSLIIKNGRYFDPVRAILLTVFSGWKIDLQFKLHLEGMELKLLVFNDVGDYFYPEYNHWLFGDNRYDIRISIGAKS